MEDITSTAKQSDEPLSSGSPAVRPRNQQNDSLNYSEPDPWSNPALHKGHHHAKNDDSTSKANGASARDPKASDQGRSSHNRNDAAAEDPAASQGPSSYDGGRRNPVNRRDSTGWNSFDGSTINAFSSQPDPGVGRDGPGPTAETSRSHDRATGLGRSAGVGRSTAGEAEEAVNITLLSEKEGVFMFQHRNYQVTSRRRGAKVVRRYSDFVWLLNCLLKRYPFRQVPLLPPKRMAGKQRFDRRRQGADVKLSERQSPLVRRVFPREAETRTESVRQRSGSTSGVLPRAASGYVSDGSYCESTDRRFRHARLSTDLLTGVDRLAKASHDLGARRVYWEDPASYIGGFLTREPHGDI